MADNIPLSTIGVKISYAVETTAGTRPTTGYTHLVGLMSTPDFSVAPNTADVTSFDNLEYTSKLKLLKDIPDNLEFGMRFGQEAYDTWETMVSAYEAGIETSTGRLDTWYCIEIPNFDKAIFIKGEPSHIGLPSMEQNSGIDATCYITPLGEPKFATPPTTSSSTL